VVALFFILTGFVNSLKPIRQARDDDRIEALSTLARSAFNRTGRLVFPATVITAITWFVCQLGFFTLALESDSHWMRATGGRPSATWGGAIVDLFKEILDTWLYMNNKYDQPQWTLSPLLKGSFWVYSTLFIMIYTKPVFRIFVEVALYAFSYAGKDCMSDMYMPQNRRRLTCDRPYWDKHFRGHDLSRTFHDLQPLCPFHGVIFSHQEWSCYLCTLLRRNTRSLPYVIS
jgi:hypothetical protein